MIIIPAIDIIDNKPVRLYQGDYEKKEIVGEDILEIAKSFEKAGADYIHLVDLDGAKEGRLINKDTIVKVANAVKVPVEVGGGIRTYEDVKCLIENGISRVILGTVAMEDRDFVVKVVNEFGIKIAVGVDCRDGYLCARGWLEDSKLYYIDFCKEMEKIGVDNIILTDISKDGTLTGTNTEMIEKLKKHVNVKITASGGVKDIEDIKALKEIDAYGVIAGKALYSGSLNLEEAIYLARRDYDAYEKNSSMS